MRSRTKCTLRSGEVHAWAISWMEALQFGDQGPKCTKAVVFNILLIAAARMTSIFAACRDLSRAPSDQAVRDAIAKQLPDTADELQQRINQAVVTNLPRSLLRRKRAVAIDLTLIPYHGLPDRDPGELFHGAAKSGTSKFHGYASAYVIDHGFRYTLALIRVGQGFTMRDIVADLVRRVRALGVRIKVLLLDRAFYAIDVVRYLKRSGTPFVMPAAIRGRKPADPKRGLRAFLKKRNGWYLWTMKRRGGGACERVRLAVASVKTTHRKTGKKRFKKLLYASWGVRGTPIEMRELYRKRFGIESSYRQMNQARIRTCTRCPRERLLYVAIALILRNVWVWMHFTHLAEDRGAEPTLRLYLMRFRRLLEWFAEHARRQLHSGDPYVLEWEP